VTGSTFQENSANAGGGIFNDNNSHLAVINSGFYTNTVINNGGGINNVSGTLTVTNGAFAGNSAAYGGGIRNDAMVTVTLTTFHGNSAYFGGGIHNVVPGALTVDNSTFSTNTTVHYGAGIYNGATLTVTNSTFDSNSGEAGGGIYNDLTSWVYNSTFYSNTVNGNGGGIINNSGTLTLTNSTLNGNSAGGGGGISNGATLHYRNTLIANSPSGGDCLNTATIGDNINNLVEDGSCSAALSGDPALAPPGNYGGSTWTCALLSSSPAIDSGDNSTCLANDQRGALRDDWNCDIGAFELKFADSASVVKSITGTGTYSFGPTKVKIEVLAVGSLDSLTITKTEGDHPGRTGSPGGDGVGWGEYFILDPNLGANGTFAVNLTLPALFIPDGSDKVCRYVSGTTWDCAADAYSTDPFNTVTRDGVTAFSDWAVGQNVGPTAVQLLALRAHSPIWIKDLYGLVAGALVILAIGISLTVKNLMRGRFGEKGKGHNLNR
jgi:hypothetical protein